VSEMRLPEIVCSGTAARTTVGLQTQKTNPARTTDAL